VNDLSVRPSLRSESLRVLVPLAALAAMAAFAARERDASGALESGYLAVLAAAALLPVAFLAPWPALELGAGAVLAAAAVWSLPPGPGRGAAVVLVLIATLAVALGRRLFRVGAGLDGRVVARPAVGGLGDARQGGSSPQPTVQTRPYPKPGILLGTGITIPLALALQVLLRGNLLLAPALTFRTAVALIALPVAGALAVSLLARRHGAPLALTAAATAIVLAPGFNVNSTLALLALAAGDALGNESLGRTARCFAMFVLAAPIAWEAGPGLAATLCGLALWRPRLAAAAAVPIAAWLGWTSGISPEGLARQLAWLPLLVPAAVAAPRERLAGLLTAALAAATVPQIPDLSALAAPLALAALSLRRDGAFVVPQGVWTGAVLTGTALLASYPWLREEPVASTLSLLGLPAGPALSLCVVLVFLALAGLGVWMGRGWGEPLRSARLAGLAAACLVLALLLGLPSPGRELLAPQMPVVIDAGHPVWEIDMKGHPVRGLVLDSSLTNGAGLRPGAPVARVSLRDAAGRTVGWTVRAGDDTGEWAARRPDVARLGTRAPAAWVSWVAGDFFAQRYRCEWTLATPVRFSQLRIERAPGAPADLALALYQLEIRR